MDETLTVTELSTAIGRAVDETFPDPVWVRGEIRDLNRAGSGHVYFTLVDPEDDSPHAPRLPVTLFASDKDAINWKLKKSGAGRMTDGTEVRIRGAVSHYASRGTVQLRMTWIDTEFTLGRLAAMREALIRRLGEEGLLEANAGRPLALVPLRVGLATSVGSAAYADFLHELETTGYAWQVIAHHTTVQGAGAAAAIAGSLAVLQSRNVDVIALVRGGGSQTELSVFDDESVARAIAECAVPVLTGIGHEVDLSVADRVAHTAYKTPTAAAAGLAGRVRRFVEGLDTGGRRLEQIAQRALRVPTVHLDAMDRRLGADAMRVTQVAERRLETAIARTRRAATARTAAGTAGLAHMRDRLDRSSRAAVQSAGRSLDLLEAKTGAADPHRIVARGFAVVRRSGRVVTDVKALAPDEEIQIGFRDGSAAAVVRAVDLDEPWQDGDDGPRHE